MAKTSDFHKSEMLGYLISKVGRFVENEMMRNIMGQQRSGFDFREVMDKKKILLVEDDNTIRVTVGNFLARQGFDVEVAEDGAQALELLKERLRAFPDAA